MRMIRFGGISVNPDRVAFIKKADGYAATVIAFSGGPGDCVTVVCSIDEAIAALTGEVTMTPSPPEYLYPHDPGDPPASQSGN